MNDFFSEIELEMQGKTLPKFDFELDFGILVLSLLMTSFSESSILESSFFGIRVEEKFKNLRFSLKKSKVCDRREQNFVFFDAL